MDNRWLASICLLIAVGMLTWGSYVGLTGESERQQDRLCLEVDDPTRELGERPVGREELSFRIRNPSVREYEFLNITEGCGLNACLYLKDKGRQAIPPGGELVVEVTLLIGKPGAFEFEGEMYLNEDGLRVIPIVFRGTGIAPVEKEDATPANQ